MNKEKLMTDTDTDKLALISDCPFLMCVFYVPSNEMTSHIKETQSNERTVRNFSGTVKGTRSMRSWVFIN